MAARLAAQRFAVDSMLEGTGFEPPVPLQGRQTRGIAARPLLATCRGGGMGGCSTASGQTLSQERDQKFESAFLQRRVYDKPVPCEVR